MRRTALIDTTKLYIWVDVEEGTGGEKNQSRKEYDNEVMMAPIIPSQRTKQGGICHRKILIDGYIRENANSVESNVKTNDSDS